MELDEETLRLLEYRTWWERFISWAARGNKAKVDRKRSVRPKRICTKCGKPIQRLHKRTKGFATTHLRCR